jgi:hypothetical protein
MSKEIDPMPFIDALLPFSALAVAVILIFGLVNMMRGGSANTSQKLMRMRVLVQFITIALAMLLLYLRSL